MSKTTQLIDEITHEARSIRHLTEELKERYRTMGALLLSARALVPEHRWNAWLQANLEWNAESAETIIEADFSGSVADFPMLPHGNGLPLLEAKHPKPEENHEQPAAPQRKGRPPKANRMR